MSIEEDLLKSDFEQCFEHLRHYDNLFISMSNFLYSGYAAVIVAVFTFYSAYPRNITSSIGITCLLLFSFFVGILILGFLIRNRIYYVFLSRFINEIRRDYLIKKPMDFKNESGMYKDPQNPTIFNPGSTHMILMYFVILCNSSLLAGAITFLFRTIAFITLDESKFSLTIFIFIFIISVLNQAIWILCYFWLKDKKKTADEVLF